MQVNIQMKMYKVYNCHYLLYLYFTHVPVNYFISSLFPKEYEKK